MSDFPLKRRDFLVGVGVSGLGLVFGLDLKPAAGATLEIDKEAPGAGVKMAWVRITPDGAITIMAPSAEMGQGTTTALAVVFAEELDGIFPSELSTLLNFLEKQRRGKMGRAREAIRGPARPAMNEASARRRAA